MEEQDLVSEQTGFVWCDNCGYNAKALIIGEQTYCPVCNEAFLNFGIELPEHVAPDDPMLTYALSSPSPSPQSTQAIADHEGLLQCRELLGVKDGDNLYDAIKRLLSADAGPASTDAATVQGQATLLVANHISPDSWLNFPHMHAFKRAYEYASTQTKAIPALSKCLPEEIYYAVDAINRAQSEPLISTGGTSHASSIEPLGDQPSSLSRNTGQEGELKAIILKLVSEIRTWTPEGMMIKRWIEEAELLALSPLADTGEKKDSAKGHNPDTTDAAARADK